ncbi:MAG TPA: MFS transporter [Spirochaetia bacterium]|nr:MFS transporter [Spirochaetia bacterium]
MNDSGVKLYPYRWVVLITFMLINVMVQVLWICYAPVATLAASSYGVTRDNVDLLANLFMLIYIPMAFPAAWAIDTFGFKKAVGFGAILMGVFGLLRAVLPTSYPAALVGTIGISIGQPFLMSAFTKLAAEWFPQKQRATITGIIFLAVFLGIGLGESLGPTLVGRYGLGGMQLIYGVAAAVAVVLFLGLARAKPPTPASPAGEEVRALVLDSLKQILRSKDVYLLALALFIGSGIVNGVFTLIDGLSQEKSFTTDQGVVLTALLLVGGIVGSVVVPALSDGLRRRKLVVMIAILVGVPSTLGMVFGTGYLLECVCFFAMGLCVTGATPVAYQYGAEITHPAPEGTSNGIFALMVQASGLLIVLMDALRGVFHDSYLPSFLGLGVLLAVCGLLLLSARESPKMGRGEAVPRPAAGKVAGTSVGT